MAAYAHWSTGTSVVARLGYRWYSSARSGKAAKNARAITVQIRRSIAVSEQGHSASSQGYGGGQARRLQQLPPGSSRGHDTFRNNDGITRLHGGGENMAPPPPASIGAEHGTVGADHENVLALGKFCGSA